MTLGVPRAHARRRCRATIFIVVFPLTFASSAFVPTETHAELAAGFAEHQPMTLVINAVRA